MSPSKPAPKAEGDMRRMFETLVGNLPGLVYRCRNERDWTGEFFSEGTLGLTGYPASEFMGGGRSYAEVIHPEDRERVWEGVQAAVARREPFTLRYRIVTASGGLRHVCEQGCGVFDASGGLEALEGFITDVTEQELNDQRRRLDEERLRMLFDGLPVAAWEEDFSGVLDQLGRLGLLGAPEARIRAELGLPEVLASCVSRLRIVDVNREALRLHRATSREQLLSGLATVLAENSTEALTGQLLAICAGRSEFETDTVVRTFDGDLRDVHLLWSVAPGFEKTLGRVMVSLVDITERRRVQDEAVLLQSLTRALMEAPTEAGAQVQLLRQVCGHAGWAFGEAWAPSRVDGRLHCRSCWPEEGVSAFREATQGRSFAAGEGLPGRVWFTGQPVWLEDVGKASIFLRQEAARAEGLRAALGVPVFVEREVVMVLCFYLTRPREHDRHFVSIISAAAAQLGLFIERRRTSEALQLEQALTASILRSLPGMFYLFDHNGRLLRWNANFAKTTGIDEQELPGTRPEDVIAPEDHERLAESIRGVYERGTGFIQATLLTRGGERIPYFFSGERFMVDGKPHLVGTAFNLSALHQAQVEVSRSLREAVALHAIGKALSASTEMEPLVDGAMGLIAKAADADLVVIFKNTPEGLRPLGQGVPPRGGALDCMLSSPPSNCLCFLSGGQREPLYVADFQHDHRTQAAPCAAAGLRSIASLPLLVAGELIGVLGLGSCAPTDFAQRGLFLEAMASTIALGLRNAVLFDNVRQHAAELEYEVACRRQAEQTLRLQASALNAAANAIMITNRDGLIEWVNPAWTRLTGYSSAEALNQTPRLLCSGSQDADFYARFWNTILEGKPLEETLVNRRKDGSLYHEHETITPLANEQGEITHFIAIKEDITGRLALEEQLRQSQKMEAIGQLAGGVAHDFNNLLTVIQGNLALARLALEDSRGPGTPQGPGRAPVELDDCLTELGAAADRAAALTRQLLAFSRRHVMQPRCLDLNETLAGTMRLLQRLIGEDIQLQLTLHPRPLHVSADPGMLDQVLMNLAVNARDAMPGGGTLTLCTGLGAPANPPRRDGALYPSQHYAFVRVCDTGAGIPPEVLPRIFEPFFTTKEPGKGTGLGLATVFGIVRQHNGVVEVLSEPGRGACFDVFLPLEQQSSPGEAHAAATALHALQGETILLVEDDAAVRRLAQRILEGNGYKVLPTADGPEALALVRTGAAFDLLLTDMIMPKGMTGQELASLVAHEREAPRRLHGGARRAGPQAGGGRQFHLEALRLGGAALRGAALPRRGARSPRRAGAGAATRSAGGPVLSPLKGSSRSRLPRAGAA